jgi:membrane protease subunit HflC
MNLFGNRIGVIALAAVIVLAIFADASLFTVEQTEQTLITQFGRPVRVIQEAGLHAKIPFVQTVIPFDKRLLAQELPGEEVILGDQRRLIVDCFTLYRIVDPLRYYQSVGALQDAIHARMNSIVSSSLRRVLGNNALLDVLSADRERIMTTIRNQVNGEMSSFGVSVVDVRIRRADLPAENTQAVLQRMQSERQRIAAQARAEGAATSIRIHADADRERTVLVAQARAQADQLRGEGEATAIKTYADAYGKDPQFYSVWRTLETYRVSLANGQTRLVLTPGDAILRFLERPPTAPGQPVAAAQPTALGQPAAAGQATAPAQPAAPGQPPAAAPK